jgi:hypothetical protein
MLRIRAIGVEEFSVEAWVIFILRGYDLIIILYPKWKLKSEGG